MGCGRSSGGIPGIFGMLAWIEAGRISSISQYFETASRSSSSSTSFGPVSISAGKAPLAKTKMK
jgi:hypothetical protein